VAAIQENSTREEYAVALAPLGTIEKLISLRDAASRSPPVREYLSSQ
jgi:hypothetical protein